MRFVFTLCLSSAIVTFAFAQKNDAPFLIAEKKVLPQIIELRHTIHRHPELSNRELNTAKLVADHLHALGLEVRTGVAYTGVVGILKGGKPGKVVALRADMDALPITEETTYSFKSTDTTAYNGKKTGVMHACGHDIHMGVMLGAASVLSSMKDKISGTVLFIFQPAEEGTPPGEEGGASLMLKEGLFDEFHPDAIFGLHSAPDLFVGQIGYSPGATNASSNSFTITISGKSAHAASPDLSIDPVVVASQVVLALQTIRSRNFSPYEPSVVTVAQIHGGVRDNIIPSEVVLGGTVRLLNPHLEDEVEKRFHEILEGTTRAAGASYKLNYQRDAPVNMSDSTLQFKMLPTMERILGKNNVRLIRPAMAADDFAYFAQRCKSFFFDLGTTRPGTNSGSLHTSTFMGDDAAIGVGIRTMSALTVDFLSMDR